jgi:hypothetical protein
LAVRPWHTGCLLCVVALLHLSLFFRFVVLNSTGSTDNTDNIGSTDQWSQLPRALEGEVKGGSSLEGGRLWRKVAVSG